LLDPKELGNIPEPRDGPEPAGGHTGMVAEKPGEMRLGADPQTF